MGYKVLVDELTVHSTVGRLPQPDGTVLYQNGLGQTYLRDEVVADDKVAEDWKEALESGEGSLYDSLSKVLEQSSDDPQLSARRLGLPFEGYDDMDEEDILVAMKVLPSAAIQRIKEYEGDRDEPRERIASYNIGYGESPMDRQENLVSGDVQDPDEDKAVRRLSTREVPEEGVVIPGEGYTGTGDPQIPYGTREEDEEDSGGGIKGATAKRRGRRERKPKSSQGSDSGDSSSTSANE